MTARPFVRGKMLGVGVALIAAIMGTLWVAQHRREEFAMFQLHALGRALAAYRMLQGGTFPDSVLSLERVGVIRRISGKVVIVTAPQIPGFRSIAPPDIEINLEDFEVGWGGSRLETSGALLHARRVRSAYIQAVEDNVTKNLAELADRRKARSER